MSSWRHPGRTGAVLFSALAALLGGGLGLVSRVETDTPTPETIRAAMDVIMTVLVDLVEEVRAEVAPDPVVETATDIPRP